MHEALEAALSALNVSTHAFLLNHSQRKDRETIDHLDTFSSLITHMRQPPPPAQPAANISQPPTPHTPTIYTQVPPSHGAGAVADEGLEAEAGAEAKTETAASKKGDLCIGAQEGEGQSKPQPHIHEAASAASALGGMLQHAWQFMLEEIQPTKTSLAIEHTQESLGAHRQATEMVREGLLLALIITTLQGEDIFSYYPNLKSRQELITNVLDDDENSSTAEFYTSRIASVEIVRRHVLQRHYFVMPESAVSILEKKHVLKKLDDALYDGLPTDNDKERHEALLQRMVACSSDLRCEVELSAGSTNWVLHYKRALEDTPMWLNVALNLVFVLLFEEHGTEAEVCVSSAHTLWVDLGHFGLPFFPHVTWLLLLMSLAHLAGGNSEKSASFETDHMN